MSFTRTAIINNTKKKKDIRDLSASTCPSLNTTRIESVEPKVVLNMYFP
jgi:hypothetical protein